MKVTVDLSKPISYAHKGNMEEGTFVELTAPNFKQLKDFLPIKQAFISAVTSIDASKATNDTTDNESDVKITGGQAIAVMMQSSCDMTKIYLFCAELFKAGAALLDGEQKLTAKLIEEMELADFEKIAGEYIANFIASSLMDGM